MINVGRLGRRERLPTRHVENAGHGEALPHGGADFLPYGPVLVFETPAPHAETVRGT